MASEQLNVIALISGGKDSFYSALHCLAHGHRVVALANLFPAPPPTSASTLPAAASGAEGSSSIARQQQPRHGCQDDDNGQDDDGILVVMPTDAARAPSPQAGEQEGQPPEDLNSFMYQTVGHQVIPLYAAATGLPVYRKAIVGGASNDAVDYEPGGEDSGSSSSSKRGNEGATDETESMMALLRAIKKRHPEANAVCAGAILSTYQRTRVESVAVRLGLLPLAFLWKYPVLPTHSQDSSTTPPASAGLGGEAAQLLRDMATAGLEARIIKVASAGLDERFLWECVSSEAGSSRVARALQRFGGCLGPGRDPSSTAAVLGEGGEFETLVIDGPRALFKRRIEVSREMGSVVQEGGGSVWLNIGSEATVVDKEGHGGPEGDGDVLAVRKPALFDKRFQAIMDDMGETGIGAAAGDGFAALPEAHRLGSDMQKWAFMLGPERKHHEMPISQETAILVAEIQDLFSSTNVASSDVLFATIVLRNMADFSTVNAEYGRLFTRPNPPSRVTVSCGSLLPSGCGVAIYLTFRRGLEPSRRRGLHVQSCSYWAPANIGPYSQAISAPLFSGPSMGTDTFTDSSTSQGAPVSALTFVLVAGQIPLVPATMTLPPSGEESDSIRLQTILSLQHLWRIGVDTQVQLWTSAVAYLSRMSSKQATLDAARLAALAWSRAHTWKPKGHASNDDDDDEEWDGGDVDPWDRQYNRSRTWGVAEEVGGDGGELDQRLPDRAVFAGGKIVGEDMVPPFFAAEVEELPRQASIEWHAHMGLANVPSGVVQVGWCSSSVVGPDSDDEKTSSSSSSSLSARWESKQLLVRTEDDDGGMFVHGVVYVEGLGESMSVDNNNDDDAKLDEIIKVCIESNSRAVAHLSRGKLVCEEEAIQPSTIYVDAQRAMSADKKKEWRVPRDGTPVIPCRSLWGGVCADSIKQVVAVGVFRSRYVVRG